MLVEKFILPHENPTRHVQSVIPHALPCLELTVILTSETTDDVCLFYIGQCFLKMQSFYN